MKGISTTRIRLPDCSLCGARIHPTGADRAEGTYECGCGTVFAFGVNGEWREVKPEPEPRTFTPHGAL
jgi:hypothetical protein